MTYEEMWEVTDASLEEAEAATLKVDNILDHVPIMNNAVDDLVVDVDELHEQFEAAANAYAEALGNLRSFRNFDEIIAAATKVRDTSLAWARYVEVAAAATAAGRGH
jgi:hypothetical protein